MQKVTSRLHLGARPTETGVHFALKAPSAREVILCVEGREIPLEKREEVWEVEVKGLKPGASYTYKVDGKGGLLDPYAKAFTDTESWVREGPYRGKGLVTTEDDFDWEEVASPNRPLSELILYELHVRAFTAKADVAHPGTFLGLVEAIPYLRKLGVNAIELLPVYEFDPCSYEGGARLKNFWGYGPLGFFAPMSGYAYLDPIREFKTLVREMHRAGIEVILDVVYNHTGEGPLLLYEEAPSYYLMSGENPTNFSGCGNTLACNSPYAMELILDSLRYWAGEMGVDGFRFDLASILTRGEGGQVLDNPPLLQAIKADPLLSQKKLIAESWDCGGLYQVGQFPRWGPWSEWNGPFRDTTRRFLKGDHHQAGPFGSALCASPELYRDYRPSCSLNFVTAHDGFSLQDLVSYNKKHNEANGENNRDGLDHNESWNCGVEGPSDDPTVLSLRARQKRNFFLALLLAQGVPMIQMGDEVGHTKGGNNNTWCQDNELSYFPWDEEKQDGELLRFVRGLIAFRKGRPILKSSHFLTDEEIAWHGPRPHQPNWEGRFVAYTLEDLYVAFNAQSEKQEITLPDGKPWLRIVDTALLPPHDFSEEEGAFPLDPAHPYVMESYSAILLVAPRPPHGES